MKTTTRLGAGSLLFAALLAACSSGSSGSGGGTTTTTGAGGTGCHGDDATWQALTAAAIPCQKNSDCCVVVNGCLSESQVVAAATKDQAKAAWPYCEAQCNACIPPAIEVVCDQGSCAGREVDLVDAGPALLADHCGDDAADATTQGVVHFSCGG
jgi:hypothetical protein